jgi:hypothetical protein
VKPEDVKPLPHATPQRCNGKKGKIIVLMVRQNPKILVLSDVHQAFIPSKD